MKIVSAEEMRAIDRSTSERFGVPSLTLMKNAGAAVADYVLAHHAAAGRIVVFCGKGNNGGDGFVAARRLHERGKKVQVILLADSADLRGDAAAMFSKLPPPAIAVHSSEELKSEQVRLSLEADLYIDAVLGTGFKPPVSGLYAEAIAIMNASQIPVIAVDIPSGADADAMGPQAGTIARADAVVTFTAPRPAHLFSLFTAGPTVVAAIGSPEEAIVSRLRLNVITGRDIGAFDRAASRGVEQRELRPCPGGRRIARKSWIGGNGRDGGVARGRRALDGGYGDVCVGNGSGISSRVND